MYQVAPKVTLSGVPPPRTETAGAPAGPGGPVGPGGPAGPAGPTWFQEMTVPPLQLAGGAVPTSVRAPGALSQAKYVTGGVSARAPAIEATPKPAAPAAAIVTSHH